MTLLSQIEYDNVSKEYRTIFNESVLPRDSIATVDEVWNVLPNETVLTTCLKKTESK